MKKLTTEEFILRCLHKHANHYNYSLTVYTNSITPVKIICSVHGEISVNPRSHMNGSGCPFCYYELSSKNKSSDSTTFISKANQIHHQMYDYSKIEYLGSDKKIEIICKLHGSFFQRPADHLKGHGCNKCNGGTKFSQKECIEKIKQVFGDLLIYNQFEYKNSSSKIQVICPTHGPFVTTPSYLWNGYGCSHCSYDQKKKSIEYKESFEKYRDSIRKISNENFVKFYYKINPTNLKRGNDYHLDHIISIYEGFINNIPIEYIASPNNLRIISAIENRKKGVKSIIRPAAELDQSVSLDKNPYNHYRKNRSKKYQITDLQTNQTYIIESIIDWCRGNEFSPNSVRWAASYNKGPFKDRYIFKQL